MVIRLPMTRPTGVLRLNRLGHRNPKKVANHLGSPREQCQQRQLAKGLPVRPTAIHPASGTPSSIPSCKVHGCCIDAPRAVHPMRINNKPPLAGQPKITKRKYKARRPGQANTLHPFSETGIRAGALSHRRAAPRLVNRLRRRGEQQPPLEGCQPQVRIFDSLQKRSRTRTSLFPTAYRRTDVREFHFFSHRRRKDEQRVLPRNAPSHPRTAASLPPIFQRTPVFRG